MRIDKLISECGIASRKETALYAKRGLLYVNGVCVKRADVHVDPERDEVVLNGRRIVYEQFIYVMLNKPAGYISATEDSCLPVVTELLPEELQKRNLFPCGRLDRDTLGLMILTNDGKLSHYLLSPRHHVSKVYRFRCESPITASAEQQFIEGMTIDGGEKCKTAKIRCDEGRMSGYVTLVEGKYHQVKRMFEALDNKITYLERVEFAEIPLDTSLERGEWRYCTEGEIEKLKSFTQQ